MKSHLPISGDWDPVAKAAAEWTLRHDRGMSAVEQDEFLQWLSADPRHRTAWAEHRWGWDELDRLVGLQTSMYAVPDPDLLAPRRRFRTASLLFPVLAAAAALVLFLQTVETSHVSKPVAAQPRSLALIERRELADGSTVELNRGAMLTEYFTPGERRVRLDQGEAYFTVAHDTSRPFIVEAAGVAVRAVGTEFNVRLESSSVEVLVTEGKVSVARADAGGESACRGIELPLLEAGERTVVSLAPAAPAPQVTIVPPAEIEARLAWQPRLLDFTDTSLAKIIAEFNCRNPVRLTLGDTHLGELRLSATFRSDNVEGFMRLMESDFGVKAEWRGDSEIVLSKAEH